MNENDVYEGVIDLSVSLTRQAKTMTLEEELTEWISLNYSGFQLPFGNSRGLLQAAFRRAKEANNLEGMDALIKAFKHNDGTPLLWRE